MAILDDVLSQVSSVTVETAFTPPIVLNDPFKKSETPSPLMQMVKPRVTLKFKRYFHPAVMNPYGNPEPSKWPLVQMGVMTTVILLAFGLFSTVKMLRR